MGSQSVHNGSPRDSTDRLDAIEQQLAQFSHQYQDVLTGIQSKLEQLTFSVPTYNIGTATTSSSGATHTSGLPGLPDQPLYVNEPHQPYGEAQRKPSPREASPTNRAAKFLLANPQINPIRAKPTERVLIEWFVDIQRR